MPRHNLMKIKEVLAYTQVSRSTIYVYMKAGTFPKPVRLTPRRTAWLESDLDKWMQDKISARKKSA